MLLIKNKLTKVNTTIQWVKKIMKASATTQIKLHIGRGIHIFGVIDITLILNKANLNTKLKLTLINQLQIVYR